MRELDKTKIYDLSELSENEKEVLLKYLQGTSKNRWGDISNFTNKRLAWFTDFNSNGEWLTTSRPSTSNAKELFYTLENVQVDCRGLSQDKIQEMVDVYKNNGFEIGRLNVVGNYKYLNDNNNRYCVVNECLENKTTITYEKFVELFGEPVRFGVGNGLEKPQHYSKGIDTFERMEANCTKEECLAFVRGNLDKYTWRDKGQDLDDFEKIIAYAKWGIKLLQS